MAETKPDDRDRPVKVTKIVPSTNSGACRCSGIGGVHNTGQPGCRN